MTFDLDSAKLQVRNFVERYPFNKYLVQASEKTKVEKEFIFVGAVALSILLIFLITGGEIIIDIVGFVYPFYMSLKAIESDASDDDKQWLTYWIVFVLFKIVENIADILISFIPFYFVFKVAFLVWCCHPSFKGAALVYDLVFKTYVVPALGIHVKSSVLSKAASVKQQVSHLEIFIDKLVNNTENSVSEDGEGFFVEVAALSPSGVSRSAGLEGTFFKTQVAQGAVINFQHKIDISPLPHSDGVVQFLIKEKHTYGDDVVLAEKSDLPISTFVKGGEPFTVTLGSFDLTFTAKYISA